LDVRPAVIVRYVNQEVNVTYRGKILRREGSVFRPCCTNGRKTPDTAPFTDTKTLAVDAMALEKRPSIAAHEEAVRTMYDRIGEEDIYK